MQSRAFAGLQAGLLTCLFAALIPAQAAEKSGIFETVHRSSVSYTETAAAVEAGLKASGLNLHAVHDVRVPEEVQEARVYVLTHPDYLAAAADESPRTISAQILRVAVFTRGEELQTFVNMASPVAHAMVYYAGSDNYASLLDAAGKAAQAIRDAIATVPGETLGIQQAPMRTEKHYRKYKGDGPARMMTKFRTYRKSQLQISQHAAADFSDTVENISARLAAEDVSGWQVIAQIPIGDDGVYFGLTNPYLEEKMIGINSRFRKDGKTDNAPYPGVDHMPALPTDVLVIREGDDTRVLQYGQMWRMQLYFWDSGYRAFTANMGVPGTIVNSIEDALGDL